MQRLKTDHGVEFDPKIEHYIAQILSGGSEHPSKAIETSVIQLCKKGKQRLCWDRLTAQLTQHLNAKLLQLEVNENSNLLE